MVKKLKFICKQCGGNRLSKVLSGVITITQLSELYSDGRHVDAIDDVIVAPDPEATSGKMYVCVECQTPVCKFVEGPDRDEYVNIETDIELAEYLAEQDCNKDTDEDEDDECS